MWFWPMQWPDVLNAILKTHAALFITIMSGALQLFKIHTHPTGQRTPVAYPNVPCDSPRWWNAFPISVSGVLVYCVCFASFVVYLVIVAPRRVSNDAMFRRRYRGVWGRYDPKSWWFCLVQMLF